MGDEVTQRDLQRVEKLVIDLTRRTTALETQLRTDIQNVLKAAEKHNEVMDGMFFSERGDRIASTKEFLGRHNALDAAIDALTSRVAGLAPKALLDALTARVAGLASKVSALEKADKS
jgi:hypothetical protein